MKRQLCAAALALLCSGTPGAATDQDDVILAAKVIAGFTDSRCKRVVRTERLGVDRQSFAATCDNGEAYFITMLTSGVAFPMPCIGSLKSMCDPETWPKPGDVIRNEPPLPAPAKPVTIIRGAN